MDNDTAIEIFRCCYRLLRTMHDDPPPSVELNFGAGYIMGKITRTIDKYEETQGISADWP